MENMNEFDGFVMPQARMLPVILLLDVSGSMSYDSKMDELNNSVREMLESFQKLLWKRLSEKNNICERNNMINRLLEDWNPVNAGDDRTLVSYEKR